MEQWMGVSILLVFLFGSLVAFVGSGCFACGGREFCFDLDPFCFRDKAGASNPENLAFAIM